MHLGRSLLSEELCSDFTREFRKLDRQIWDKNHASLSGGVQANDGGHGIRNTVEGFVANCRRRKIYEDEMRKEQGLGSSEPVIIPHGGVPKDISVSLDDLLGSPGEFGEDADAARNGDDYFDTYFDANDQDSFSDEG